MNLPFFLNGYRDYTISKYGKKCENSYALEAWFAIPFTINFSVELSEISTESGLNTTHFGQRV